MNSARPWSPIPRGIAVACVLLAVALGGAFHLALVHHDHPGSELLGSCAGCRTSEHNPGVVAPADMPLAPELEATSAPLPSALLRDATPRATSRIPRAPPRAA